VSGATKDNINPSHYQKYPLQMIDNMQNSMTPDEFKGYLKGNIMKYISSLTELNNIKKENGYLHFIDVEGNDIRITPSKIPLLEIVELESDSND